MNNATFIIAVFCVALMSAQVVEVQAQIQIILEPIRLAASDTLDLDVRLLSEMNRLKHPVNAFQFVVIAPPYVNFIGSDSRYTLSDKNGWSTAHNIENGRVGGFSSSTDAIVRNGVLIRLQFLLKDTDTRGTIELREFRLNNGFPDHLPVIPSLRLDLVEHLE